MRVLTSNLFIAIVLTYMLINIMEVLKRQIKIYFMRRFLKKDRLGDHIIKILRFNPMNLFQKMIYHFSKVM